MVDIFELSDAAVDRVAVVDPIHATYAGVAGFDHLWPDLSPAGEAAKRAMYVELREAALRCDVPDDRHLLAQRVLVEHCEGHIRFHDGHGHHFDLQNIACPHQDVRFVFGSMADRTNADWEAIISRLSTIPDALTGYRETLEEGVANRNVVSQRQVHAVMEQGVSAAGDASSFHDLRRRLANAPVETAEFAERLDLAIGMAKDAFAEFNVFLETSYLPHAATKDAVGEERYLQGVENFLGTQLDVRATYRWGWDEVERLWAEMQQACAEINPDASAVEVLEELRTSPKYAAADQEDFITRMTERQHHALASLEGVHFDVPAEIRAIEVQVEPAGGALAPHYVGPSEDFSRPGSVWYPVDGKEHFPLFVEMTTAYHEGFPGHHLQVGIQNALRDDLSRYHRSIVWYPGSGEGWALYAEHLMGELGYLERPEYRIGLLSSKLLRASRIAIDIGIHLELPIPDDVSFHPGEEWTFAIAREMLTTRAFAGEDDATSEVLRYMGWPAQAISYKVGEQAILDLRDEWMASKEYDPKLFHSTVLGVGSVGLDLLTEQVRAQRPE